MAWNIDTRFEISINADVLRFLCASHPSAHSDVADELHRAIDRVPGAAHFCPDARRYAWVAAHTPDNRIYALAYGMNAYALRVGLDAVAEAIANGAKPAPEIGPDWVTFDPFLVDVKTADMRALLRRWTSRAMHFTTTL